MAFRTIMIKGHDQSIYKEGVAGGAITPGHLVDASDRTAVVVQSGDGTNVPKTFAVEADFIANDITDAYASSDKVLFVAAARGAEVYALVAAGATAITKGNALESAGDGTVQGHSPIESGSVYADAVVAYALEDVDNSGGSAVARIQVEVA